MPIIRIYPREGARFTNSDLQGEARLRGRLQQEHSIQTEKIGNNIGILWSNNMPTTTVSESKLYIYTQVKIMALSGCLHKTDQIKVNTERERGRERVRGREADKHRHPKYTPTDDPRRPQKLTDWTVMHRETGIDITTSPLGTTSDVTKLSPMLPPRFSSFTFETEPPWLSNHDTSQLSPAICCSGMSSLTLPSSVAVGAAAVPCISWSLRRCFSQSLLRSAAREVQKTTVRSWRSSLY